MKRIYRLFSLLLTLGLLLGGFSVFAEDAWSEEYYRVIDLTDQLSDEERISLDEDCVTLVSTYHVDLAFLVVSEETLEGDSAQELAEYFYYDCGFGYGANQDGFLAVYHADSGLVAIECYGNAAQRVSSDDLRAIEENSPGFAEEYGIWGVLYSVYSYLDSNLEESAAAQEERTTPASPPPQTDARGAEGMPDWYPQDPENFPRYHDETAPRVVDVADLFSDEAEARMEARLGQLREELGKDIVVFTDVSSYGLTRAVYAADFYDFNGYGIGPEFEGICLFICMEQGNRGFWSCCTGPVTRGLYTEEAANDLDDVLYEYMVDGEYTRGVEDWIENIRTLYVKGYPFIPDWYPVNGERVERFHDSSMPRVIDDAGLLTAEELSALTKQAAAISEKYHLDVAIHLTDVRSGVTRQEYSDMYYRVMGLGYGENYDGILLSVFKMPGYLGTCRITAEGSGTEKLTEVNQERLEGKCINQLESDNFYSAVRGWLKDVEHMERTGRVPRNAGYWGFIAVGGLLLGAIVGGIALAAARKKMAIPAVKQTAEAYMEENSLQVRKLEDRYTHTSTSKKYSPVESKSSGGSGGGGSSYSSSYSGSSGSSHSGSGRSF